MSKRILICGSGNTAHVLAGLLGADPDCDVCVFTRNVDKAAHWRDALARAELVVTEIDGECRREVARTRRIVVSADPEIARGCDAIFPAITASTLTGYLEVLTPYIEERVAVIGLPGQGGFEYEVSRWLCGKDVTILNFESAPWACRVVEFGRQVLICGVKGYLSGAMKGDRGQGRLRAPFDFVRSLLGARTKLVESPSLLAMTLMSVNAYSHPPIMYGAWKDWDGQPVENPPSFYHGIDRDTAELMTQMSDEVLAIRERISAMRPEQDLSAVIPMLTWDRLAYGSSIADPSDQFTALRTNGAYRSMVHPMARHASGHWVPDFSSRFLSEDVPYGLVPIRGIAEIVELETPAIDRVLRWSQEKLGKKYLNCTHLIGANLGETSCPQRYGLRTLEEIL